MLMTFAFCFANAQNYVGAADSCFKLKDYVCAATNFDLFLDRVEGDSNNIAYRSAVSWSLAGNKEKAFPALKRYMKNNTLNGETTFSDELLSEKSFAFLSDDERWTAIITPLQEAEAKEKEPVISNQRNFETTLDVRPQLNSIKLTGDIYPALKSSLVYKSPKAYLTNNGIALFIRINNKDVPFYVHMPDNYDPATAKPALVVLHGAIKYNKFYGSPRGLPETYKMTSDHIPGYSKNYITVYPMGINTLNWMNTERGFDMVNEIVVYLKAFLNIDDDRVELLGHSNGATGVFTYLVKSPSLYAGFYGMNTQPKVFIGGTFLQNGVTRHFYNFATDKDYYYPPQAVKTIDSLANSMGVNWHTELNKGYPHWFPSMKESLQPMAKVFEDMETRARNPYPKEIYFETDNVKYGTSDWITITGLDTLSKKAVWQKDPNFKITTWIDNSDFNKTIHREEMAFDYPHRSGAIKAKRSGNSIYIETSDVASFAIKLNREMIDYDKKVNVYLNGERIYSQKISPDKQYTLANFKSQLDRKAIWENEIAFDVK